MFSKVKREELAIIKNIDIGMRDNDYPCMWFETVQESLIALQVLSLEDAGKLIKDADVYSFKSLEGKACIIERDGSMMLFVRMAKL